MRLLVAAAMLVTCGSLLAHETDHSGGRAIVLVHGAWVGSFTFDPVVARLKAAGHKTYAPDLTGHGARRSESSPDITLEDHVADVVAVFEDNNLVDVTLVMHSYGGVAGTLAWDRLRDRVAHVVYLDAFAPEDDSEAPLRTFDARRLELPKNVSGDMVPPPQDVPDDVLSLMVPHSLKAMMGNTKLRNGPLPSTTTRTYVLAGKNRSERNFRAVQAALFDDPRWDHYVLPTPHGMLRTDPTVVAAIIESR